MKNHFHMFHIKRICRRMVTYNFEIKFKIVYSNNFPPLTELKKMIKCLPCVSPKTRTSSATYNNLIKMHRCVNPTRHKIPVL